MRKGSHSLFKLLYDNFCGLIKQINYARIIFLHREQSYLFRSLDLNGRLIVVDAHVNQLN